MKFIVSRVKIVSLIILSLYLISINTQAQTTPPSQLPLVRINNFTYQGAFRVQDPPSLSTACNKGFMSSWGVMEVDTAKNSLFMIGHNVQSCISELGIPQIINSTRLQDLKVATPIQSLYPIFSRIPNNTQGVDNVSGLKLVPGSNGNQLLVNCYDNYDGDANVTNTTIIFRQPSSLGTSPINGFFDLSGANHAGGWISLIPQEWRNLLGNSYITGHSSGISINSRNSIGPSAFSFNPANLINQTSNLGLIPTIKLMDYSLSNPLHNEMSNESLLNDLWTHMSRASIGFIPPGTRSYVTIGWSGGILSGICYKGDQSDGSNNGGYSPSYSDDIYPYYWLFDLNDLVAVKEGRKNSYDIRPYEYGYFPNHFHARILRGATYDHTRGLLYLAAFAADTTIPNSGGHPPIIMAYKIENVGIIPPGDTIRPASPTGLHIQ